MPAITFGSIYEVKRKTYERRRATLIHPPTLRPEDLLTFVQFSPFERDWARLKLNDDDLRALEILIMFAPTAAPVVPGTGGLRKMRFSGDQWSGKSGGVRVCYAYYPDYSAVMLLLVYAKTQSDDLSAVEKRAIKAELEWIGNALASGRIKVGRSRAK